MRPLAMVQTVEQNVRVVLVWSSTRNRYVKSDRSVLFARCPVCKSKKMEPCVGPRGYHGTTHYKRRAKAKRFIRRGPQSLESPERSK